MVEILYAKKTALIVNVDEFEVQSNYNVEKMGLELKMKEVLIVGENGFLGTELKKELISENVYNISGTSKNLSNENYFNLNEKHNLKLEKYSVIILMAAIKYLR